ncbi:hypothetical protein B566_EDAN015857 [Ephemera danica]|nr:hypothetical protein B566_EDAN015857 [Ephemera danica]
MEQKITITVLCFFFAVCHGNEHSELKIAVERLAARLDSYNISDVMLPTVGVDIMALVRLITQNELKEQLKVLKFERQTTFATGQQFPSSQLDLVELGGKKYFFSKKQLLSWIDAVSFCRLFGMELASVETREEDELLIKHLVSIGLGVNKIIFISANKIGRSTYLWLNGQPLIYENWEASQPAHVATEHCMCYYSSAWHDFHCSGHPYHFICEEP